jgi:hypothetical protein
MANELNFYRLVPENGVQCPICITPINDQDVAVGHLAGLESHIYHRHCVEPWINEHHSCPECRTHVQSIQLILPPRAMAPLSLLARQHPYLLNGTIAAHTAAAIGTAALQNNRFNAGTLLGLITGTYATALFELAPDDSLQLARQLVIATIFYAAAPLLLDGENALLSPIMALRARALAEIPRLLPALRMDPQHVPDLQRGLSLGLWFLVLATIVNEDSRTSSTAIAIFVVASCLATLALTLYRRIFNSNN